LQNNRFANGEAKSAVALVLLARLIASPEPVEYFVDVSLGQAACAICDVDMGPSILQVSVD